MRRTPIGWPTIKAALVLGFGLTLGLWVFASYVLTVRMTAVQRHAEAVNDRYTRGQELLSTVQGQILLGPVVVRDFLLDPERATASAYRNRLLDSYRSVDVALTQYGVTVVLPAEREQLDRLRREILGLRDTLNTVMAQPDREDARVVLSSRVAPSRERVLQLSEEARTASLKAFIEQQAAIPALYGAMQRRALGQLGFALVASLGIALVATLYAGRLESGLHEQQQRDIQSRVDLQRLSAKLLTAQEEERRTIARELHDEIGQALSAVKVSLTLARRRIEQVGASASLLDEADRITDTALSTVRDLSHLLHPALLDDLGLPAAVDWYVRGFSRRHGIHVDLHCDPMDDRLLLEIEATAYRIVQEALTNVARHAQARDCRVSLRRVRDTVVLIVEDDGIGFDPSLTARVPERGLGLIGMRERVSELAGTLRIDSAPGRGTRLTVELPARTRASVDYLEEEVLNA